MPFIPAAVGGALAAWGGMSIGTALTIDAAAIAAYSAVASGRQQKKNLEYNAAVQENQATQEERAAEHEAGKVGEEGRRFKARQRTLFAQAGVTEAGSPLLVLEDTARLIDEDIETVLRGGQRRGQSFRTQAGLSRLRGRSARSAGLLQAGSSLLSGVSTAAIRSKA